jgi:hypothetical protein
MWLASAVTSNGQRHVSRYRLMGKTVTSGEDSKEDVVGLGHLPNSF